jgi:hypothetical protein
MADDTLTLALQGEVSLEQFERGIRDFTRLVNALSETANAKGLRWEIEQLTASSALCTVRGVAINGYSPDAVTEVSRSFLEVGQAMESGTTIPYPEEVAEPARDLAGLLRTGLEAVRFETAVDDAFIREAPAPALVERKAAAPRRKSLGAVVGRIQTLTNRGSLRFVVYDRFFDKAVSCYLGEDSEDMIRNAWGRMAAVRGEISRDPATGRPLTVRKISKVELLEEASPTGYQRARGALGRRVEHEAPEQRIRRLRDG